jgi:DNA-binding NtrC family response regulator
MDAFERGLIRAALANTHGALNAAARLLGVPKNFLLRRVNVLGITERRRRGGSTKPAENAIDEPE